MNEHDVRAVARSAVWFPVRPATRPATRFPARRIVGRAARPMRTAVPRFKESRHV